MDMRGLTAEEVRERKSKGQVNDKEETQSRGYLEILAKNLLVPYNIILFILGLALVYFEEPLSAIAATGIIIFNVLISTIQEWKAKRRLDKIAVLMRPKVSVLRDGELTIIDRSEIVQDDIIHLGPGDQAQVDCEIVEERSLEMDESLLTGESSTRRKHVGDKVFSGSYCITGECWMKVTGIGDETFSAQIMKKARKFDKKKTPLQTETNAITEVLMIMAAVFFGILVVLNLLRGKGITQYLQEAVVVLDIVPIALFLLISLTYMIAAVRMADSGVLLQNSNSVESMSHVDTVCMDKTGTITTNNLIFEDIDCMGNDQAETEKLVRMFVSLTGSKNRTIVALENRYGTCDAELLDEVQFSSERKFSAVQAKMDGETHTIVMGAWSVLRKYITDGSDITEKLSANSSRGLRSVVLFDAGDSPLHNGDDIVVPGLRLLALISIRDEVRPDCKEIISEFISNGMDIKVISGDDPETVDAIFKLAEIPGERKIVSGDKLEVMTEEEFDKTVLETNIFGRMKPEQKEKVVDSLRRNGRYVAMVGDGINDVRSIKKAQVGVAVQSGSGAARGVADMVLMNDDFRAMPKAIIEGKRTVSGMRDILRLYLTRNFVLAILVAILLLICGKTPVTTIQNSAYALLTVSFAAFLMTLWAKPSENKTMILPRVLKFCVPTAVTISVVSLVIYAVTYIGTMQGWIDFSPAYHSAQEKLGIGLQELFYYLSTSGYTGGLIPDSVMAEVNARNAMFTFMLFAGIAELFILFPLFRKLSIDDQFKRDVKPTLLVILLYLVLIAFYMVPQVSVVIGQTLPLVEFWWILLPVVFLWYVGTVLILKTPTLDRLCNWVDDVFMKRLQKSFEKEREAEKEEE